MSTPLRPQFFCSRPNGVLTPLVAVDELPTHVSLRGVPRVLSPSDTQGMTSLGAVSTRAQTYVVDMVRPSAHASARHARDYELQSSLSRLVSDEGIPANQRLPLQALAQPGQEHNWTAPNPPVNGWVVPVVGGAGAGGQKSINLNMKKEYCSYWIRHGECDYQQQGCLYKHEMPTDPAMLEKLGLRDIPRWYREKYSVPSLMPNGGHRSHANNHHGQHWRDDASVKAVQYPSRVGMNGGFYPAESDKAHKQRPSNYHGGIIPDQPRAYTAMNPLKGAMAHKNGYKHIHNQPKAHGGKVDQLSFDPLDYSSHGQLPGTMGELTYPTTTAEQALALEAHAQAQAGADRAHREDILRNLDLQSMISASIPPNSIERVRTPLDATPCPVRSKRATQQPHRLYQRRVGGGMEAEDSFSFKGLRNSIPAASSKGGSNQHMHMGSNSSPTIRAGGGGGGSTMSSDPPTGPASPEDQSHSSRSSHSSSHGVYARGKENEPKHHQNQNQQQTLAHPPGAIGSKRVQRKDSGIVDDDLFGLGVGRK